MAQVTITVGSNGRQYTALQAALDSVTNKDLVSSDVDLVLELWPDSEFTLATMMLDITGFTTDATRRITIRPAAGKAYYQHANALTNPLRYNAANGVALKMTGSYATVIRSNAPYTVVEGLQILCTQYSAIPIQLYGNNSDSRLNLIDCKPRPQDAALNLPSAGKARSNTLIVRQASSSPLRFQNNCVVENNTIISLGVAGTDGMRHEGNGAATVRNNAVFGFTNVITAPVAGASMNADGYYATNNATVAFGATGSLTNLVAADQFQDVGTATPDLRLKSTSSLVNSGTTSTATSSASGLARPSGASFDIGAWEYPAAATALTLTTDGAGRIGVADTLTVSSNGSLTGPVNVNVLVDGAQVGTVVLGTSALSATYAYTPASAGTKSITLTNDAGLSNPAAAPFVVAVDPPSGAVTSQPAPDGDSLTVTFSTVNAPTSGLATLSPAASNPAGAVTTGGVVTLGAGTGTAVFTGIPPGNYDLVITISNAGGPGTVTGTQPVTILSVSGNPEVPGDGEAPVATVPDAPTNVVATAGNGTVSVTCTAPANGGSAITSYQVVASTGQTASSPTLPVSIAMPNGTAATFQMRAVNAIGQSSLSAASNSVTPSAPPVVTAPGAPVIGTAVAGNGYVDVYFTAPSSNGGAAITGYTATLSTGETASGSASPIRVTAANGTARTATVKATNSAGAGPASSASNSVTPAADVTPPAPTISVTLVDAEGAPAASVTGLKWAWFDEITPDQFGEPTDKGAAELTDGSGVLTISLPNSSKTSGQVGWLIVTNSNGTTAMVHKAFSGPVEVN